jgi:hypothetical protein
VQTGCAAAAAAAPTFTATPISVISMPVSPAMSLREEGSSTRTLGPSWDHGDQGGAPPMTNNPCDRCGRDDKPIVIVFADLGEGAMLAVLCDTCWHRLQYRTKLRLILEKRRRKLRDEAEPERAKS